MATDHCGLLLSHFTPHGIPLPDESVLLVQLFLAIGERYVDLSCSHYSKTVKSTNVSIISAGHLVDRLIDRMYD